MVASVLYDEMLGRDQVIIYSNADDEAVAAMKDALDENGYEGQYTFQSFGTSEDWAENFWRREPIYRGRFW